jgi:hypothetical protein
MRTALLAGIGLCLAQVAAGQPGARKPLIGVERVAYPPKTEAKLQNFTARLLEALNADGRVQFEKRADGKSFDGRLAVEVELRVSDPARGPGLTTPPTVRTGNAGVTVRYRLYAMESGETVAAGEVSGRSQPATVGERAAVREAGDDCLGKLLPAFFPAAIRLRGTR